MHFAFSSQELRKLCEDNALAQEKWGAEVAGSLRRRLADLQAAATISDIVTRKEFFIANLQAKVKIHLIENFYLIAIPNPLDHEAFRDGEVDWRRVGRLKILDLETCDDTTN